MTNSLQYQAEILQDRYALKLAARLSDGASNLPHDISERLRIARTQAIAKRKLPERIVSSAVLSTGGAAVIGGGDDGWRWWNSLASALPLLALAIGLVTINAIQNENIANELAVVDVALLVDDLPPAAYADPGFAQFLKASNNDAP